MEGECKQTVEKRQHKSCIIKIMTGLGLAGVCQVERAEWLWGGLSQDRQTITKINKSNDKGKLWKGQGVGAGAGVQANLSSGKCIQMNVVILSNILRDAAVAAAVLLLMQQLLHKTQVQHFNGSSSMPQIVARRRRA